MAKYDWKPSEYGGYRAEMPGNVTLCVSPDQTVGFAGKPKRGTTWHAQASQWDEATRCISGYGRDEYGVEHKTHRDAMRAAERIYEEA